MSSSAFIASFGAVTAAGLYSPTGHCPWLSGQGGAADVTREQILDKPYPGFGKLVIADRLAFAAASLALKGCDSLSGESCGISMGTLFGSLSTDLRFMESIAAGFPSPALFSSTLPSSPIADVAIFYKLKGPTRVFCNEHDAGVCAFEQGLSLLHCGKAASVLVLAIYAIDPSDSSCSLFGAATRGENRAYAFLLTTNAPQTDFPRNVRILVENSTTAQQNNRSEEVYFDELLQMLCRQQTGSLIFNGTWNYKEDL